MPSFLYFLKMGTAAIIGIIALILAGLVFVAFWPFFLAVFIGGVLLVLAFIVIWAILYIALVIGVGIYYLFKPMKVSTVKKGYALTASKEAGRRQKGAARTRKRQVTRKRK